MAMISPPTSDCPAFTEGDPPFSSLGAIDRIGDTFCEEPQDIGRILDMQRYRFFRMRCLRTTLGIVDACQVPTHAAVSIRLKRLDSIRRKIGRSDTHFTLGRLDDVVGVRVICQSMLILREFSSRICASPYFYRIKDYLETPGPTGYRGINHIMRFEQPVTDMVVVDMRFEVQIRTVLQHRWAVWSEAHGEAIKLGVNADEDAEAELGHLRELSREVARWEDNNLEAIPVELPEYAGGHSISVCWRTRYGPPISYPFQGDVQGAVDWLNYLETTYPAERENALLLVGVASEEEMKRLLQLTHPLFTGVRVLKPEYWIPDSPSFGAGS